MVDGFSHFFSFLCKISHQGMSGTILRQAASPFTSLICLRSLFMRLRFW